MKKEILLNDLNCILIDSNRDRIEVELNEVRKELSLDDVFYKLNLNDIEYIEVNEEDSSYIKFVDGQELVIFHQDYLNNDIDKEVLVEYIKFLEDNGEKLAKEYRSIMG